MFKKIRKQAANRRRQANNRQDSIQLKSKTEIERLRAANRLVAEIFALLGEAVQPGVSLSELDRLAEDYIKQHDAQTLYKGYRGNPPSNPPFPGVICASVNHEICHGLPDNRRLMNGDIVGIDIGLRYKGYCGDACVTYAVGTISPEAEGLLKVAEAALHKGIAAAKAGHFLSDIGQAIETYAEGEGYGVVRQWGGHGIGRNLHEAPSVPHTGPGGKGPRLRPGMVFTIEPMINIGQHDWQKLDDGWTVITKDHSLSAQFEHTIAITDKGTEILSTLAT